MPYGPSPGCQPTPRLPIPSLLLHSAGLGPGPGSLCSPSCWLCLFHEVPAGAAGSLALGTQGRNPGSPPGSNPSMTSGPHLGAFPHGTGWWAPHPSRDIHGGQSWARRAWEEAVCVRCPSGVSEGAGGRPQWDPRAPPSAASVTPTPAPWHLWEAQGVCEQPTQGVCLSPAQGRACVVPGPPGTKGPGAGPLAWGSSCPMASPRRAGSGSCWGHPWAVSNPRVTHPLPPCPPMTGRSSLGAELPGGGGAAQTSRSLPPGALNPQPRKWIPLPGCGLPLGWLDTAG